MQTKGGVEGEISKIIFCTGLHVVFNPNRSKTSKFSLDKGGLGDAL